MTFENTICMFGKLGKSEKHTEGLTLRNVLGLCIFTPKISFGLLSHHPLTVTQLNTNEHQKLLDINLLLLFSTSPPVLARAFWEDGGGGGSCSTLSGEKPGKEYLAESCVLSSVGWWFEGTFEVENTGTLLGQATLILTSRQSSTVSVNKNQMWGMYLIIRMQEKLRGKST